MFRWWPFAARSAAPDERGSVKGKSSARTFGYGTLAAMPDESENVGGVEMLPVTTSADGGLVSDTGNLIPRSVSSENNPLKRSLTTWDLTSLGVGGIVGAGIYVLTGQAAAQYAGPAVVISFVISGIACSFSALCYSELSAMMPVAGSAYSFASAALGPFLGWVIGCVRRHPASLSYRRDIAPSTLLRSSSDSPRSSPSCTSVSQVGSCSRVHDGRGNRGGWVERLREQLTQRYGGPVAVSYLHRCELRAFRWQHARYPRTPRSIPQCASASVVMRYSHRCLPCCPSCARTSLAAPFAYDTVTDTWTITGGYINLPAVLIVIAMSLVNVIGIRESAMANNVIVGIKVTVLLIFIGVGSAYVNTSNWEPFVPEQQQLGIFGVGGVFRGAAVVFFRCAACKFGHAVRGCPLQFR